MLTASILNVPGDEGRMLIGGALALATLANIWLAWRRQAVPMLGTADRATRPIAYWVYVVMNVILALVGMDFLIHGALHIAPFVERL